jgi:dipeptidyl aminopeptidase/acylaminoacyl peptidase
MGEPRTQPYGWWAPAVSAADVARAGVSIDAVSIAAGGVYWVEGRVEGDVLVRWTADHGHCEVLPPGAEPASSVHEYGGGAYVVDGGEVWFVRGDDQRVWRTTGAAMVPVTPLPDRGEDRHADLRVSARGVLVCVRERHRAGQVVNEIVSLPADGSAGPRVVAQGWDFYSSPRPSPDGSQLAWISWRAPLMPWDGSWLWVADLRADGTVSPPRLVAGGPEESVCQPAWSPRGQLHFLSDRRGWWNLYLYTGGGTEPLIVIDAELGVAAWEFGYATYQFLGGGRIAVLVQEGPRHRLGIWHPDTGRLEALPLPYTSIKPYLATDGQRLALIGSSPTQPPRVALIDPVTATVRELTTPPASIDPGYVSRCEVIRFGTRDGSSAHAVFHPPATGVGPPPVIVRAHPGPTANTSLRLDPWVVFFTSRGFAVLEVDYRGSTGYGRAYRIALRGQWGVRDVADCLDAVRHLARAGRIDPRRVAITGSSAGGYTALRAAATGDAVAAVAVRHAIVDPQAWGRAAPKFQAHHAETLSATPSHSVAYDAPGITIPVLLIHGGRDPVSPVRQVQQLADELGDLATLIVFPDEGHGLRHPEHIQRALHAELAHFRQMLGP